MKIFGEDIDALLKNAVKQSLSSVKDAKNASLNEAYHSTPKQFKQTTEYVTQKTKELHYALYKDYVDSSNEVSIKLDSQKILEDVNSRDSEFRSLKLNEAYNLNAKWLHELYFANCFDPHSQVYHDSLAYIKLERDFGNFTDWQKNFMACAFACGQGWALVAYHVHLKRYVNVMISNHSQDVMLGLFPIIVLDMHEHAYVKDYGSDKKSYVVAMMQELNWEVIEERIKRAEAIGEVLK